MAFVTYLGDLASQLSNAAAARAELIMSGGIHYRHGNGGVTSGGVYHQDPRCPTGPEDDGPSFGP